MTVNVPRNHHFVPQHFLKAWESSPKKIIRYKLLPSSTQVEVREVSIKSTASQKDLYRLEFEDGTFEIESSIVTPKIDAYGSNLLNSIRVCSIFDLNQDDRFKFLEYLINLEARHPDIIKLMDFSSELEKSRADFKAKNIGSDESIDAVIDYLAASSTLGVMAFGFLSQYGFGFVEHLYNGHLIELNFEGNSLITSSYPVARFGDYTNQHLLVVAISPRKALVLSSSEDIGFFNELETSLRADLINLYTLAKADAAYYNDSSMSDFVGKHLGWENKCETNDKKGEYVKSFLRR